MDKKEVFVWPIPTEKVNVMFLHGSSLRCCCGVWDMNCKCNTDT